MPSPSNFYPILGIFVGYSLGPLAYYYLNKKKDLELYAVNAGKSIENPHNSVYIYLNNRVRHIKTTDTNNLDCLYKKGYIRSSGNWDGYYPHKFLYDQPTRLCRFSKKDSDVLIDEFLADCAKCKVSTEVYYVKRNFFLGSEDQRCKKKIYWDTRGYTDEEAWARA